MQGFVHSFFNIDFLAAFKNIIHKLHHPLQKACWFMFKNHWPGLFFLCWSALLQYSLLLYFSMQFIPLKYFAGSTSGLLSASLVTIGNFLTLKFINTKIKNSLLPSWSYSKDPLQVWFSVIKYNFLYLLVFLWPGKMCPPLFHQTWIIVVNCTPVLVTHPDVDAAGSKCCLVKKGGTKYILQWLPVMLIFRC